ncbi:MAG TPA: DUF2934 domain-containing protein [Candidatus Nitrosopolaris sp.]|nr:DUF2934 domain-containing protein [Candidatus Nitrosopolaris sp.]
MKTSTSKPKLTEEYMSATTIHIPQLPHNYQEIRRRAQKIYVARGGMMGMTLNDWLEAEQQLKQKLGEPTDDTNNHEKIMKTTNSDLTLDICAEDGSRTQFCQSDEESVGKLLRQLVTPRLFNQPLLTLASEHSVSAIPSRTIDLILARTESPPPLTLPTGWLDAVETDGEAFPDIADLEVLPAAGRAGLFAEIHTLGDWMVRLKVEVIVPATVQEKRIVRNHFLDVPVIPFRLRTGGIGLINPANISRVTVYPAFEEVGETALPADLLESVRA